MDPMTANAFLSHPERIRDITPVEIALYTLIKDLQSRIRNLEPQPFDPQALANVPDGIYSLGRGELEKRIKNLEKDLNE